MPMLLPKKPLTHDQCQLADLNIKGWALVPNVFTETLLDQLRDGLAQAYAECRAWQVKRQLPATEGTCHHILTLDPSFMLVLSAVAQLEALRTYFCGPYILNSFGGVLNVLSHQSTYVGKIHRDLRSFSGELALMANVLIMLDDFTPERGATYLLTGSHRMRQAPTSEHFFQHAERAVGKAGDVVVFNSNLWHAAGTNTTELPRRALTLTLTKPFVKQQLDYPRLLGDAACAALPESLQQLVGYHARVPASLEEWYQPPESRFYKSDQG